MKNYTFFGKNIRKTGEFYFTNPLFCAIVLEDMTDTRVRDTDMIQGVSVKYSTSGGNYV